jgi:hypothetical protein
MHRLAWFIPFFIALLGTVRARGIFFTFGVFHNYLLKTEIAFGGGPSTQLPGWEHFNQGNSAKQHNKTKASAFAYAFWAVLDLATLATALIVAFHLLQ